MVMLMMWRKSPEDVTKMMGKMGPEEIEHMVLDMMPRMMDSCFSEMDREWR